MYTQVGAARADSRDISVAVVDRGLRLTLGDESVELGSMWLRDSATDAESRDPVSGQRLFGITDLPPALRGESARLDGDEVEVVFAPGGDRSVFDVAELFEAARKPPHDPRNESGKRLWRRASDLGALTRVPYPDYREDKPPALRLVVRDGFALLSEVPRREGFVTEVAETFGFVRETN